MLKFFEDYSVRTKLFSSLRLFSNNVSFENTTNSFPRLAKRF